MTLIPKESVAAVENGRYPPPYDRIGTSRSRPLSDAGGLTQFGAYYETLEPGAFSSQRHWHEAEDEFLYMLEGVATLIDDAGEREMRPGDAAAWKAGAQDGHHLVNRTDRPVSYLIVGTRAAAERCHYPDIDLVSIRDADGQRYERRDGTRYAPEGGTT